jgi:hypothetical protein
MAATLVLEASAERCVGSNPTLRTIKMRKLMTKVVIDSFDTEEQAVAFVDWLKRKFELDHCRLVTTQGTMLPYWDGIDQNETDKNKITMNICVSEDTEFEEGF